MKNFFHDLFFPHFHNNFRSKLLHHRVILLFIVLLFSGTFFLSFVKANFPQVLGISSDVTTEQLLSFTNQKRQEDGAGALSLNDKLNKAASDKAQDMFAENYWAHNSPTGKTPWVFIKNAGYQYVYAGENLARGFTDSKSVVDAWMASPEHRENMLSRNYNEVGFAVKNGTLLGEDTVLVVEMLGNTSFAQNSIPSVARSAQEPVPVVLNSSNRPLIDSVSLSRNIGVGIISLFILVLSVDFIVIERKKVTRFVGHNLDHVLFLSLILLMIFIIARGVIL
ncbi:MAG TPA: CAP domain-containing protein [Patescibacteria group bacterium]|nr:CAP domain-containing protein [Patescibacteria group bacterium]